MVTTTAHHVIDLDHHLRELRAANSELRARIEGARHQLDQVARARVRREEIQRTMGAMVLAAEADIEQARADAAAYLAALETATEEDVRRIAESSRIEAEQLRHALDAGVGGNEPPTVVPISPLAVVDDAADRSAEPRRVAI